MTRPLPTPPITPFERLQVTDGLLMNADRWRRAHEYHRLRQNVHYQSLNQPGIVCGLGVQVITPPDDVPGAYRDGRWLQIQPGLAIDLAGNPIVVPQPETYRIVTEATKEPITVYLVLRYVDPDHLGRTDQPEMVRETFRIDEKNSPPEDLEVEVCRILLQPRTTQITAPIDVFFPTPNSLDLRYRALAQARPRSIVHLAQLSYADPDCTHHHEQLADLVAAVPGLYPPLQGAFAPEPLSLSDLSATTPDLLYLTGRQAFTPTEPEATLLQRYLTSGGLLVVDVPAGGADLGKSVLMLAQQLGTPLDYLENLNRRHPLRTQPFLFAALPATGDQPIRLLYGGGIVMIVGNLAAGWGLDEQLTLSRSTLRAAQELGINLLHFAWQRRQMLQLLGQTLSAAAPATTPVPLATVAKETVPSKSKRLLDQLIEGS